MLDNLHMENVPITTAVATTGQIPYGDWEAGEVFVPTGSSITTLTWHAAPKIGGTFLPAQDSSGAVAQTVEGGKCYPIPSALAGARSIKAVGNAAGTISVSLKG